MPVPQRSASFAANAPFYVFMALFPVLDIFTHPGADAAARDWAANWTLAGAACLGLGSSLFRGRGTRGNALGWIAALACLGLAALFMSLPGLPQSLAEHGGPWFNAFKPMAYVLFALAWAATFGLPDLAAAVRSAAFLGLAVLVYLLVSGLYQDLPLMDRVAALPGAAPLFLALGLCAALNGPGRVSTPLLGLILGGLVATLSFTALAAGLLVVVFTAPWSLGRRLGSGLALALPAAAAFVLGPGRLPLEGGPNTWWAWIIGLDLFINDPRALFTGFPITRPLPLSLSGTATLLLAHSKAPWASTGMTAGLITPFWLRLALNWGLGAVGGAMLALSALLMARPSRLGAGLFLSLVLTGLSCALFYAPGQAVACLLLALAARERSLDFAFAPPPEPDTEVSQGEPHREQAPRDTA